MQLDVSKYATIPFVEKGRDFDGCDCWGIPFLIYRDLLNIELPSYSDKYHNCEDQKELGALITESKAAWVPVNDPQPFDLLSIRLKGQPMHVGLYVGEGRFIHCLTGSGTVIERVDSIVWRDRIVGYFRRA